MLVHSRSAAWWQACFTLATAIVVIAAVVFCARRPFDRDTLAIQVGQLQSQAAEMALAERLLARDRVAPGFVREHARQLRRKTSAVSGQLRAHPPGPGLAPSLQAAQATAAGLDVLLHRRSLVRTRTGDGAAFDALADRMDALHARLHPGG